MDVHVVVDRHAVDGAGGAAHAVTDLSPLERGPGRRGARPEMGRGSEKDFTVRADVDRDPDGLGLVDPRRERHADRVGTDEAGDERQEAHDRVRRDRERHVARGEHERMAHDRRIRREPDVGGIDPEQQMMHAGVADDHGLVDPLREHTRLAAELADVSVQDADDAGAQFPQISRIELRERDAGHQVSAEHGLGIQARDRGEPLARLELEQRADDAGGSDVDGETEFHRRGVAALDRQDATAERRDGHAGRIIAQRRRQRCEHRRGDRVRRQSELGQQLLQIRRLVMLLARQVHLHDLLHDTGRDRDTAETVGVLSGTEDLKRRLVERGRRLHGDRLGHVALTREPVPVADQFVAELDFVHDRGRWDGAGDELHATRRAPTAAAARGGDVDAGRVRGAQDGGGLRDAQHARLVGRARSRKDRERDRHRPILALAWYPPADGKGDDRDDARDDASGRVRVVRCRARSSAPAGLDRLEAASPRTIDPSTQYRLF